jgi:hypothetical protein
MPIEGPASGTTDRCVSAACRRLFSYQQLQVQQNERTWSRQLGSIIVTGLGDAPHQSRCAPAAKSNDLRLRGSTTPRIG